MEEVQRPVEWSSGLASGREKSQHLKGESGNTFQPEVLAMASLDEHIPSLAMLCCSRGRRGGIVPQHPS